MKTLLSFAFVGVLSLILIISCVRSCVPTVPVQQGYAPGYGMPSQGYTAPAYNQPVVVHDNVGGGIVSHGLAAGAGYMLGKHAAKSAQASAPAPVAAPVAAPATPAPSKWKRANKAISVAPSASTPINLSKPSVSSSMKSSGGSKWGKRR